MNLVKVKINKQQKKVLFISIVLFVILYYFVQGVAGKRIIYNTTPSLDGYVYLLDMNNKQITRNSLVAFYPPENPFYKEKGLLKQVWGMPGDKVEFKADGAFYINDIYKGKAKKQSSAKKPVELEQSENGTIKSGQYFVGTPHPDSFDSRYKYIGNINEKNIIGIARRII